MTVVHFSLKGSIVKKRKKVLSMVTGIFSLLSISLLYILISKNSGTLPPLKDKSGRAIAGSISEKIWIEVNGMQQGMFIRSENPRNPVLLYVHGGPGTPMLQFVSYLEKIKNPVPLEKYFTICYWDQRGSGMSYSRKTDASSMTIDTMVKDTHEVTEYLKNRFGQNKIYLLGHSWGSYLGVKTIEQYPEDYFAYIGVGQISDQKKSERLAYQYMMDHAKKINDEKTIAALGKFDPTEPHFPLVNEEGHLLDYLMARSTALIKYGIGHIHEGLRAGLTFKSMVFRALFSFKGYTISEKVKWFLGADFSMVHLFPVLLDDNLFVSSTKFDIPFYIVQGVYDYQVSQTLAEKYVEAIDAPHKEFILFENSAHSPNLEEPERFNLIMQEIDAQCRKRQKG